VAGRSDAKRPRLMTVGGEVAGTGPRRVAGQRRGQGEAEGSRRGHEDIGHQCEPEDNNGVRRGMVAGADTSPRTAAGAGPRT
jgi:hypothetical protein